MKCEKKDSSGIPFIRMEQYGADDKGISKFRKSYGQGLPFADVEIECEFSGEGRLPRFRGSTLRGAFGHHLKKTVCHRDRGNCRECIVRSTCAYSYIFEGVPPQDREKMRLYPYIPQPFILLVNPEDPTTIKQGDRFTFGIRLFGKSLDLFPYIAYSLIQMAKEGLGKDRIPFQITRITQPSFQTEIYQPEANCIHKVQREYIHNSIRSCKQIQVQLLTPLRIRVNGKEPSTIRFDDFIHAVIRRFSILSYFYGSRYEEIRTDSSAAQTIKTISEKLHSVQFRRFSGRQKRPVEMSGLLGTLIFEGNLKPFMPWLSIAEVIGVGKATSFGFGRIHITPLQEDKDGTERID